MQAPITVHAICIDQESGKYLAFLQEDPRVQGTGYTREEAALNACLKAGVVAEVIEVDASDKPTKATTAVSNDPPKPAGMTFDQASAAMLDGKCVARPPWQHQGYLCFKAETHPHWTLVQIDENRRYVSEQPWPSQAPKHDGATRANLAANDWIVVEPARPPQ